MALEVHPEVVKELFFGGAFGLCAGIAARLKFLFVTIALSRAGAGLKHSSFEPARVVATGLGLYLGI